MQIFEVVHLPHKSFAFQVPTFVCGNVVLQCSDRSGAKTNPIYWIEYFIECRIADAQVHTSKLFRLSSERLTHNYGSDSASCSFFLFSLKLVPVSVLLIEIPWRKKNEESVGFFIQFYNNSVILCPWEAAKFSVEWSTCSTTNQANRVDLTVHVFHDHTNHK